MADWRATVAGLSTITLYAVAGLIVYSAGGFSFLPWEWTDGFALAADATNNEEVAAVKKDVAEVKEDVATVKASVGNVQASLYAKEIDAATKALCANDSALDEIRLLESYRRQLQEQHRAAKGEYHQSPPCEVLLKLRE